MGEVKLLNGGKLQTTFSTVLCHTIWRSVCYSLITLYIILGGHEDIEYIGNAIYILKLDVRLQAKEGRFDELCPSLKSEIATYNSASKRGHLRQNLKPQWEGVGGDGGDLGDISPHIV